MHDSVLEYVMEMTSGKFYRDVLEVGSYDVNGSVRPMLAGANTKYVGVDRRSGPKVDRVCEASKMPFMAESFDLVVSTEMLEHDTRPWRSVIEMARVLRKGGTMILTARGFNKNGFYPYHDYRDYWRFTVEGLSELVEDADLFVVDARPDPGEIGAFVTAGKK